MILFVMITLVLLLIIVIAWVKGIDTMQQQHPDYKGEDFLDWDDNRQHTENI